MFWQEVCLCVCERLSRLSRSESCRQQAVWTECIAAFYSSPADPCPPSGPVGAQQLPVKHHTNSLHNRWQKMHRFSFISWCHRTPNMTAGKPENKCVSHYWQSLVFVPHDAPLRARKLWEIFISLKWKWFIILRHVIHSANPFHSLHLFQKCTWNKFWTVSLGDCRFSLIHKCEPGAQNQSGIAREHV